MQWERGNDYKKTEQLRFSSGDVVDEQKHISLQSGRDVAAGGPRKPKAFPQLLVRLPEMLGGAGNLCPQAGMCSKSKPWKLRGLVPSLSRETCHPALAGREGVQRPRRKTLLSVWVL